MLRKKTAVLFAFMLAIAMIFSACSQTEMFDEINANKDNDRVNAIETNYTITEASEEYGGVVYQFPRVEGMTNLSKQANLNGHMKRTAMKATKDFSGERGVVSDSNEVLIMNDYLFSIRFETTLDVDIPTRAVSLLVRENKFVFSIENLFGRAEDNPAFANMKSEFEAAGVDASFTDEDFRKLTIYFEGEEASEILLHVTYYTDQGYDISLPIADLIDYMTDDVAAMFEFAR